MVAGISALASTVGATASSIISAKNSAEDENYHCGLKSIVRGNNILNNIILNDQFFGHITNGDLKHLYLITSLTKINDLQITCNGINCLIDSLIIFVIPEKIKAASKGANNIKQFIDSSDNKIDKSKVLSNDKLIDQLIKFLRCKDYDVSM